MAKKDYTVHIDLNQNQLLNAALQTLASPPTTPVIGQIYWNTSDNTAYCWTGASWLNLSQLYTHPVFNTQNATTTGAIIISGITLNNGHITSIETRELTRQDLGAAASIHAHNYNEILNLPPQSILGNISGSNGPAQALNSGQILTLLGIAYGSLTVLQQSSDTTQRTWSSKDINDYVSLILDGVVINGATLNYTPSTRNINLILDREGANNDLSANVILPNVTTTDSGLMMPGDKIKLDGISPNANNYVHPTNNPGSHPFSTEILSGLKVLSQLIVNEEGHVVTVKGRDLTAADIAQVMINNSVNNGTDTTWSSSKIYGEIQNAITQAQSGALTYKGEYNVATNTPNLTSDATIKVGYTYVATSSGTFAGQTVEAGDMIIAKVNNPGSTATNWQIVNKNIPAIVQATDTIQGIIQIATQAEVYAGGNNTKAVTPFTLRNALNNKTNIFVANFGDGSTTTFNINHLLNTQDLIAKIYRNSDKKEIECEVSFPTASSIKIEVNTAPASNAYRVVIYRIINL